MSELNFNVAGDPGDDEPFLIVDGPPPVRATGRFEPGRFILQFPPTGTTGAGWFHYDHGRQSFRIIVPPPDPTAPPGSPDNRQFEAGLPPCIPPEYHGDADKVALHYGPAKPPMLEGESRLVGKAWTINGAPHYPLEFSLFSAPRFFAMGDLAYLDDNASFVRPYGVDGARIFYAWNRNPAESQAALEGTVRRLYERHGMRSFVTAQANPHNKSAEQACHEVVEALMPLRHMLYGVEGTNEQWVSEDAAVRCAEILKALGVPTAVGYGDADVNKVVDLTNRAGVDVVSLHPARWGDEARQTRQCWDFHNIRYAGRVGEPGGPGSSVNEITAPDILAKLAAFNTICGAGDFCFHWGGGIFGEPMPNRPRLIRDVPNIDAQLRAVGHARTCLPLGMENWHHFHGAAVLEVSQGSCEKQYAARSGNEMVQAITDAHGVLDFRERDGNHWDWQLFDPSTGEPAVNGSLDGYILKAFQR